MADAALFHLEAAGDRFRTDVLAHCEDHECGRDDQQDGKYRADLDRRGVEHDAVHRDRHGLNLGHADEHGALRFFHIRRAKALGLLTIQRFFLFDSLSFENVLRQSSNADAVDLLPGTMPRVLERLKPQIRQPIIASGLLADKQDVVAALSAGAQAVSTTKPELWEI